MTRGVGAALFVAVVAVVVLVAVQFDPPAPPYDLDGADGTGYLALRLLIEEGGTDVARVDAAAVDAAAVAAHPVVFVPVASAARPDQVNRWSAYVRAGGVLVLGTPVDGLGQPEPDPTDAVAPGGSLPVLGPASASPGECDIDELGASRDIAVPINARGLEVGARSSCFGDGDLALVTVEGLGGGRVVNLASPDLFTNETMGAPTTAEPDPDPDRLPDNGFVALQLLGGGRLLTVVTSGVAGSVVNGTRSWTDHLATARWAALWQLAVGFCWYAWHRGRRHGRVVVEPAAVRIESSDYVDAVGNLLRRQGNAPRAAATLRHRAVGRLARDLGLPMGSDAATVVSALAVRTGRGPDELGHLLVDGPVPDDAALAALATQIRQLQQEATHVPAPNPA